MSLMFMDIIDGGCLCSNVVDDEEEMLYGDSNASTATSKEELNRSFVAPAPSFSEGSTSKAEPSHWCMIIRENGVMEVWNGFCIRTIQR